MHVKLPAPLLRIVKVPSTKTLAFPTRLMLQFCLSSRSDAETTCRGYLFPPELAAGAISPRDFVLEFAVRDPAMSQIRC